MKILIGQIQSAMQSYLANVDPLQCIIAFAISICIYMLLDAICAKTTKTLWNGNKWVLWGLLSTYTTFVLAVTLFGRRERIKNTIYTSLSSFQQILLGNRNILFDILFNVLLLLPIGTLLALRVSSKHSRCFIFALALAIEITQGITGLGLFEVSDLINNILGGIIGVKIGVAMKNRKCPK